MMRGSKLLKKQRGQTLIEAVVALAIALLLITSVLTLVNRSNARATNARQSTQASKLAQEGMEIVRNIRDVDADRAVRVGKPACTSPPNYCEWRELYTDNQENDLQTHLEFGCIPNQWCLLAGAPSAGDNEAALIDGVFTRLVVIDDDKDIDTDNNGSPDAICADPNFGFSDTKRITVTVTWESPIGSQERKVVSCLTNWQR